MRIRLLSGLALIALLSGCAPVQVEETTSTPEPTVTASAEESAEASSEESFTEIAIESCERAMQQGVEELATDGFYRQVMIPKDQAQSGYSAAWQDLSTNEVALIWETDAFYVCSPANTIWLSAELGSEPDWAVTEVRDGFELTQDFGEFGIFTTNYKVEDGVFTMATAAEGPEFEIRYLSDLAQAKELIESALAEFEN